MTTYNNKNVQKKTNETFKTYFANISLLVTNIMISMNILKYNSMMVYNN